MIAPMSRSRRLALGPLLALSILSGGARAQYCEASDTTWGGNGDDWVTEFLTGPAGEAFLVGGTTSYGAGDADLLALCYDAAGVFQWARTWGGGDEEDQEGAWIDPSATGGIYLTGVTESFGPTPEVLLVKLGFDGSPLFGLTWNSGAIDDANTVFADSAGNLYVGGNSDVKVGPSDDAMLLRWPPTPNATAPTQPSWVSVWGDSAVDEHINAGLVDDSSGSEQVFVTGNIEVFGGTADFLIQRYNTILQPQWSRSFGGPGEESGDAIAVDAAGNLYVCGETDSGGAGGLDVLVTKWDQAGNLLWAIAWGGADDEGCGYIALDAAGNLHLAGETTSFGAGSADGLMLKVSPDGVVLGSATWGGLLGLEGGLGLERPVPTSGVLRAAGFSNSAAPALVPCVGTTTVLPSWVGTPTGTRITPLGITTPRSPTTTTPPDGTGVGVEVHLVELAHGCFPTYCTAGTSTSGCQALLASTGLPSASAASGFTVEANAVEGNKDGLFFFGTTGRQANAWGNGSSFQCVVPPVKRTPLQSGTGTNGACDGAFALDLNALFTAQPAKQPSVGATVQLQCWHRDPFNTSNQTTGLSDALEFVMAP